MLRVLSRGVQDALAGHLAQTRQRLLMAQGAAMQALAFEAQGHLRASIRAGVRGPGRNPNRLANTLRATLYPARTLAVRPAISVSVSHSARRIIDAGDRGAMITSARGRYLTIPIPGSPAAVIGGRPVQDPRGPMTRAQHIARQLGGELAVVPAHGGRPAMLVANPKPGAETLAIGTSLRAVARPINARGELKRGVTLIRGQSVPLFWLVPLARVPRRFGLTQTARQLEASAPSRLAQFWGPAWAWAQRLPETSLKGLPR